MAPETNNAPAAAPEKAPQKVVDFKELLRNSLADGKISREEADAILQRYEAEKNSISTETKADTDKLLKESLPKLLESFKLESKDDLIRLERIVAYLNPSKDAKGIFIEQGSKEAGGIGLDPYPYSVTFDAKTNRIRKESGVWEKMTLDRKDVEVSMDSKLAIIDRTIREKGVAQVKPGADVIRIVGDVRNEMSMDNRDRYGVISQKVCDAYGFLLLPTGSPDERRKALADNNIDFNFKNNDDIKKTVDSLTKILSDASKDGGIPALTKKEEKPATQETSPEKGKEWKATDGEGAKKDFAVVDREKTGNRNEKISAKNFKKFEKRVDEAIQELRTVDKNGHNSADLKNTADLLNAAKNDPSEANVKALQEDINEYERSGKPIKVDSIFGVDTLNSVLDVAELSLEAKVAKKHGKSHLKSAPASHKEEGHAAAKKGKESKITSEDKVVEAPPAPPFSAELLKTTIKPADAATHISFIDEKNGKFNAFVYVDSSGPIASKLVPPNGTKFLIDANQLELSKNSKVILGKDIDFSAATSPVEPGRDISRLPISGGKYTVALEKGKLSVTPALESPQVMATKHVPNKS